MNNFEQQIAALSPEQRMIFEKRLKQKRLNKERTQGISKIEIPKRKNFSEIPLSFAQQRLWFFQQLNPDNSAYNIFSALRIEGNLSIELLEKAFTQIVSRHESLRTTFTTNSEGLPIQVIAPSKPFKILVVDLKDIPDRDEEIEKLATKEAQKSFNLTQPLLRITLLKLAETDYVLLVTIHHIISDRWSLGIFVREMKVLYEFFSKKQSISYINAGQTPLPELPIQYADWTVWQQQYLQGKVLQVQTDYWTKQLANLPILKVPTDRPRPAIATYRGAKQSFKLSKTLSNSLKTLSVKQGITLFTLLLTVFKVLLYKYTNQDDIVVGTDIANRNRVETEGLIGFLINTLVLRTDLSGNPTFTQLLSRVGKVTIKACNHQDLSFNQLVDILKPKRDLSEMVPLFQVKFDLQLAKVEPVELSNLTVSPLNFNKGTTKFELRFNLSETDQGLTGLVEYSTDIFDSNTITRMVEHYRNLLERIVANPQQHLWELSLLTEFEQHQLLREWNNTKVEYPLSCIHELFDAQVEKTPDAVGVVFEEQQLTYRELNSKANQLAHHLRSLGVKPEVLVGICVERSLEMVIGLLAILKAGGAYVPLDPNYPQERLAYMLEDSQPSILLTQQYLLESLPFHQAQVICIDSDWERIASESTENPASNTTIDNLAYVIYTSGSTGKPKGAMNSHSGICNRLLWMQDTYQLTSADAVLQKTPFSFDVSVWEFFWTLMTGARLVVAQPEGHRDPNYLVNLIRKQRVTTLHFVPSMLQAFLEAESLEKCQSLVRVIASGEALPAQLKQRFFNRLNAQLHNLYGPTEAAVDVTYWQCKKDNYNQNTVPIGQPIANIQIYILDKYLKPVPMGVAGEVYIGGVGVARGYLNRPDLSAEKFIPNPFSKKATRLYKTGDLARYLPSREIEYIGRIDHQVKVRGFRIELGEIEAQITKHPAVRESVVVVREDLANSQQIIAYIVAQNESTLTNSELQEFLASKLPSYMIPAVLVSLEALPLTPNGKVDCKALPAPEITRPELEETYIAPQTFAEKQLADIWAEVLGLENLGINDNFFALGGNSLLAIHLIAKIKQHLGQSLQLSHLLQEATISSTAKLLRQQINDQSSSPLVAIQPHGSNPPLFFVHPIGGNILSYYELSRHLGSEQPFYGLQALGLNRECEPYTRMEDMASGYIEALRLVQPEGPYFLGGWSMGGVVAFEMAQQLQRQSHEVALLAMLDSPAAVASNKSRDIDDYDDARMLANFAINMARSAGKSLSGSVEELQELEPEEQLNYFLKQARMSNLVPPDFELQQLRCLLKVFKSNVQALRSYIPQAYPNRITYFQASDNGFNNLNNPALTWDKFLGKPIETITIPGNHYTILTKPHIQVLAEQLNVHLNKAYLDKKISS